MTLIIEKGVEGITLRDVADELGIAKGTLYLYFRSRADILAETARVVRTSMIREIAPSLARSCPLEDRLTKLMADVLRLWADDPRLFELGRLSFNEPDSHGTPDETARAWFHDQLRLLFEEARRRREIRDVPPYWIATFLLDWLDGRVTRRLQESQRPSHEVEARAVVSVLLHGIASRSPVKGIDA